MTVEHLRELGGRKRRLILLPRYPLCALLFAWFASHLLVGCDNSNLETDLDSIDLGQVDLSITQSTYLDSLEWIWYESSTTRIIAPKTWRCQKTEDYELLCQIKGGNTTEYFAVLRYELSKIGFDEYLDKTLLALSQDTVERSIDVASREIRVKREECNYLEANLLLNGDTLTSGSTILTHGDYLYDLTIKLKEPAFDKQYQVYQNILYHFTIDSTLYFGRYFD